jgi:hypothetical protein
MGSAPDEDGHDWAERDEGAGAKAEERGAVGGGALRRDGEHVAAGALDVLGELGRLTAAAGIVNKEVLELADDVGHDAEGALVGVYHEGKGVDAGCEDDAIEEGDVVVDRNAALADCIGEVLAVSDGDVIKPEAEHDEPWENGEIFHHSLFGCKHAEEVGSVDYKKNPDESQQRQRCENDHFNIMVHPIIICLILIGIQCLRLYDRVYC